MSERLSYVHILCECGFELSTEFWRPSDDCDCHPHVHIYQPGSFAVDRSCVYCMKCIKKKSFPKVLNGGLIHDFSESSG